MYPRLPFAHEGHYEFFVVSFSLTNTLVTFQGLMNEIFKSYFRKFVLLFFADILVHSKTLNDYLEHLKTVLIILS